MLFLYIKIFIFNFLHFSCALSTPALQLDEPFIAINQGPEETSLPLETGNSQAAASSRRVRFLSEPPIELPLRFLSDPSLPLSSPHQASMEPPPCPICQLPLRATEPPCRRSNPASSILTALPCAHVLHTRCFEADLYARFRGDRDVYECAVCRLKPNEMRELEIHMCDSLRREENSLRNRGRRLRLKIGETGGAVANCCRAGGRLGDRCVWYCFCSDDEEQVDSRAGRAERRG